MQIELERKSDYFFLMVANVEAALRSSSGVPIIEKAVGHGGTY